MKKKEKLELLYCKAVSSFQGNQRIIKSGVDGYLREPILPNHEIPYFHSFHVTVAPFVLGGLLKNVSKKPFTVVPVYVYDIISFILAQQQL